MFKATEVKKKIDLVIDLQINLFVQNFRTLLLAVSPATVMGLIKN